MMADMTAWRIETFGNMDLGHMVFCTSSITRRIEDSKVGVTTGIFEMAAFLVFLLFSVAALYVHLYPTKLLAIALKSWGLDFHL